MHRLIFFSKNELVSCNPINGKGGDLNPALIFYYEVSLLGLSHYQRVTFTVSVPVLLWKLEPALKTAVTVCVPVVEKEALKLAIPLISGTLAASTLLPSLKVNVPVGIAALGDRAVTVAVIVTLLLRIALLGAVTLVVVLALLTSWSMDRVVLPL